MIVTGLTGSLGSGKTTVGRMLDRRGAVVIDADQLVREWQQADSLLLARMKRVFGDAIVNENGELNRQNLADVVFSNTEKLHQLNRMVHPWVRRRESALIEVFRDFPIVVMDIPLLFENNLHRLLPYVIVVSVDEDVRAHRLIEQRNMTEDQIQKRLQAQMPQNLKCRLAHFIIENSQSRRSTEQQVDKLIDQLHRMNSTAVKSHLNFTNPFNPF